jgi:hypothetical protein
MFLAIPREKHGSELYEPIMILYNRWENILDVIKDEREERTIEDKPEPSEQNYVPPLGAK